MTSRLSWKAGFEIELMAPPGVSRRDLAKRVARRTGGTVHRFFHPQSEPSAVPGQPVFENLTLGFEVRDRKGARTAAFVDDLTLQLDLDRERAPSPGWHRILADDSRLLQLIIRHCDPEAEVGRVLDPLAELFGVPPQNHDGGIVRVEDKTGQSVAICAPLPGERERPCEIVTAPIERDHARVLGELLADAQKLGFEVPVEGATHIHFDGSRLGSALAVAGLVAVFGAHGDSLRNLVRVNVNCIRLGGWPAELAQLTQDHAFMSLDWDRARTALAELPLTKYCDFNLCNLIRQDEAKNTFEVRILPAMLDADAIVKAAELFQSILIWVCETWPAPVPVTLFDLLQELPLSSLAREFWMERSRASVWTPHQTVQSWAAS